LSSSAPISAPLKGRATCFYASGNLKKVKKIGNVASKIAIEEQNVVTSKLAIGKQNIIASKLVIKGLQVDETSSQCNLKLTIMIMSNPNDEIPSKTNWEF
jgi:hypothetical protein